MGLSYVSPGYDTQVKLVVAGPPAIDSRAVADFDGDSDTDVSIFRPGPRASGSCRASRPCSYGLRGDVPVACDYDGDGDTDRAVFRPSDGRS